MPKRPNARSRRALARQRSHVPVPRGLHMLEADLGIMLDASARNVYALEGLGWVFDTAVPGADAIRRTVSRPSALIGGEPTIESQTIPLRRMGLGRTFVVRADERAMAYALLAAVNGGAADVQERARLTPWRGGWHGALANRQGAAIAKRAARQRPAELRLSARLGARVAVDLDGRRAWVEAWHPLRGLLYEAAIRQAVDARDGLMTAS